MKDRKIKIFFHDKLATAPCIKIILDGINNHKELEFSDNELDADYIFLMSKPKDHIKFPNKTIIIDYRDSPTLMDIDRDFFLYFKRSVVNKSSGCFHDYNGVKIIPISYCIKDEAMNWSIKPLTERQTDISIFFEPSSRNCRHRIAKAIEDNFKEKYNIRVGLAGKSGREGRLTIQKDYYNAMLDSKIVVTCNPPGWEGDWRLFEALSCAPLVLVDTMITPTKNSFLDGEHLVYYNREINKLHDLFSKIDFYLENLHVAQNISTNGYNHARMHHTAECRMSEILEEIRCSRKL